MSNVKIRPLRSLGEFWDTHDLAEYWEKTKPVDFEVDIQSEITYYAVDAALSKKIREITKERGISSETLLNLWIQEGLQKQSTTSKQA